MIKSFRHKGLQKFFETGTKSGIQPQHADKLRRQLAVLDNAQSISDVPGGWRPHQLSGGLIGHYAIWVSGNWRLTFHIDGTDIHLLDYLDYH